MTTSPSAVVTSTRPGPASRPTPWCTVGAGVLRAGRRRCVSSQSVGGLARRCAGDRRPATARSWPRRRARPPGGLGDGVAGPHHHLGRDAPVVGALAADQVLVDGDDRQPRLGGPGGEGLAAGSGADDDQVDLGSSLMAPAWRSRQARAQTSEALLRCTAPSTPLTNCGDSSVDRSRAPAPSPR